MPVTASEIVRALEEDVEARRRLARLLASEVVAEPDLRLALANAILKEVATKGDLRELEERLRGEVKGVEERLTRVEQRLNAVEQRLSSLEGSFGVFLKLFLAFNVPTLVAVIGVLLKMVVG